MAGLRVLVSSEVPEGKGLASSAAIGVAVLQAVAACLDRAPEPRRLALLGQRAEQLLAGAPCGSMDQLTAAYGERGHLLLLLCRPAEIVRSIPLPPPLEVWGIDSGIPHAVAGAAYRRARCAAFMGKALLGCQHDYLTELDPSEVDAELLPESLTRSGLPSAPPRYRRPGRRGRARRRLPRPGGDDVSAGGAGSRWHLRGAAHAAGHRRAGPAAGRVDARLACRLLALRPRHPGDRRSRRSGTARRLGPGARRRACERRREAAERSSCSAAARQSRSSARSQPRWAPVSSAARRRAP